MTCQSSRTDYAESVKNVIEATVAMAERVDAYLVTLGAFNIVDIQQNVREWNHCTETLVRLLDEQRRCLADYQKDAAAHF